MIEMKVEHCGAAVADVAAIVVVVVDGIGIDESKFEVNKLREEFSNLKEKEVYYSNFLQIDSSFHH